jgi:3-methyladenine DNA glycosylase AlkD
MNLREELYKNQDLKYKEFTSKLIPNIDNNKIIGVRIPTVRKIAKQAFKENANNLCELYEEQIVFGFTIAMKKCNVESHISDLKSFVKLIDNWSTCDLCASSFKFVNEQKEDYFDFIISYLNKSEFETRFAIVMLMNYYFDDEYIDRVIDVLKSITSDYYYVNMALAWALSSAFVKYEDKVTKLLKSKTLSKDVQNKTIQKIKESYKVSNDTKMKMNSFKI